MATSSTTDASSRPCHAEKVAHVYNLSVRKQMKPTLTHQFALEWPWPTAPQTSAKISNDESASHAAEGVSVGWLSSRRFGRSTYIMSLTGDPFSHGLVTRRVAVCASTGSRVLLPLVPQEPPSLLPCGHAAYWRLGDSQEWSSRHGMSHMAEVIVGEVGVMEHLCQVMRANSASHWSTSFSVPRVHLSGEKRVPVWNGAWVKDEAVQSRLFYSLPFKVLWLSERPGHLLVSLPCEERVVTLYAAARCKAASVPAPLALRGSLSLPRGVVPLDVTDIEERPFVAVGTYEHGVLLCGLDAATCALTHIVRVVTVRTSLAVYPVVHVASLFPSLAAKQGWPAGSKTAATPSSPWVTEAASLRSLSDGALLCSSPYDGSFTLVKLSDGRAGVPDDFPASKSTETFQFVTRNAEGVWATTSTGSIFLFHVDRAQAKLNQSEMRVALVSPVVRGYIMNARRSNAMLCLTDGHVVYQETSAKYVRDRTCFWMAGVDDDNVLHLFNCRTRVDPYGKLQLTPMPAGGASASVPQSESLDTEEPERQRKKAETPVADLATGTAFIFSAAGVLQVVAAHHRNVISLVTWSGNDGS